MAQSPANVADRNLLFGILAVNLNFITRDQLITAMNTWVLDKSKPLDAILLEQKSLTAERHTLLQALVVEHLKQHKNDPQQSLAAISSVASVKQDLARLQDQDVEASLAFVGIPADAGATRTFSVGAPTASGQRFRILRPHARGGLGQVYVAEDQELHREVALKEMQDKHAADATSRNRFVMEAEITGALEHPGIVPVYGLGQYADGRPYYAMRFIRGDSLKEVIEKFHQADVPGRDPGERSLELRKMLGRFIDVCEAIQYAHDRGILHRDLKPGNIMLGKYGETLVVDWGLAKPLDHIEHPSTEPLLKPMSASGSSQTLVGAAVGTPQYMSPEQAEGRLDIIGPASDVYSLGATLYVLLTGKTSVQDSEVEAQKQADLAKLLGKVIKGNFPKPREVKADIDAALEAICLKAMALKPADRYPSPRALADDLEHWLADEPVTARPDPWTVKARRWIGKHRTLVTSGAAALVVGVVSLTAITVVLANANDVIQSKNKALFEANGIIQGKNDDLVHANIVIKAKNDTIEAEVKEKEKQRLRAVQNEQKAVLEHKKAEERLDQSVETLKLFANDVRTYCEDAIVPGESKQKLFDVLLDQLEALAAADFGKEFNEDKVRARIFLYETVALTRIELGRSRAAEEPLKLALKLAEQWLTAKPGDEPALGRRAAVLHLFGVVHQRRLNTMIANQYFTEAYEIRKRLLGNDKVERFTPGKTIIDVADSLDALERWDEAIQMRLQAHDLVTKRITEGRAKREDAFFTLDGLNWTYQKAAEKTDDYVKKKEYLDKANETSSKLLSIRKSRVALERWVKYLGLHARTELREAELAAQAKQDAKAKGHLAEAERQFAAQMLRARELATSNDLLKNQRAFAQSLYELGRVEQTLGRRVLAESHLKRSLHLREAHVHDYPTSADEDASRLLVLAALGRHAEAAGAADMLEVKLAGKQITYALAKVYALCIPAVAESRRPAPLTGDDKKLQEAYRTKALSCLERSIAQGNDHWVDVRTNPDLAPLRDDPRFDKILKERKK